MNHTHKRKLSGEGVNQPKKRRDISNRGGVGKGKVGKTQGGSKGAMLCGDNCPGEPGSLRDGRPVEWRRYTRGGNPKGKTERGAWCTKSKQKVAERLGGLVTGRPKGWVNSWGERTRGGGDLSWRGGGGGKKQGLVNQQQSKQGQCTLPKILGLGRTVRIL